MYLQSPKFKPKCFLLIFQIFGISLENVKVQEVLHRYANSKCFCQLCWNDATLQINLSYPKNCFDIIINVSNGVMVDRHLLHCNKPHTFLCHCPEIVIIENIVEQILRRNADPWIGRLVWPWHWHRNINMWRDPRQSVWYFI